MPEEENQDEPNCNLRRNSIDKRVEVLVIRKVLPQSFLVMVELEPSFCLFSMFLGYLGFGVTVGTAENRHGASRCPQSHSKEQGRGSPEGKGGGHNPASQGFIQTVVWNRSASSS